MNELFFSTLKDEVKEIKSLLVTLRQEVHDELNQIRAEIKATKQPKTKVAQQ